MIKKINNRWGLYSEMNEADILSEPLIDSLFLGELLYQAEEELLIYNEGE